MTRADELRDLEGEVGVLIRRIRRVVGERARAVHPELVPTSYLMLTHVHQHGPLRASAICSVLDIDKSALSRQVQHLIDLGLLDRSPDPDDGRATLLAVTGVARARLDDVTSQRRAELDAKLGEWTVDELAGFVSSLRRYNESLGPVER